MVSNISLPPKVLQFTLELGVYLQTNSLQQKQSFIRRDGHKTPLQQPYMGPFRVIQHGEKYFKIDYGGKPESISVDRLKPAYTDPEVDPVFLPPRRGRPKK